MDKYLKMADVFDCEVDSDADLMFSESLGSVADFSGYKTQCRYAVHAINSHDELVAEVERLRLQLACAFMAGWEEGINGMECDEAEVASVDVAEQFASN